MCVGERECVSVCCVGESESVCGREDLRVCLWERECVYVGESENESACGRECVCVEERICVFMGERE